MKECKWCNQTYEPKNLFMDNGFCSAQCHYDWDKKAESMGIKKRNPYIGMSDEDYNSASR